MALEVCDKLRDLIMDVYSRKNRAKCSEVPDLLKKYEGPLLCCPLGAGSRRKVRDSSFVGRALALNSECHW